MSVARAQILLAGHLKDGVSGQVVRFLLVGAASYLVNLGLYSLGLALGLHYLTAAAGAFSLGFVFNFLTNRFWTFGVRGAGAAGQFVRFCGVQVVILGLDLLLLRLAVGDLGLSRVASQGVIIILLAPISFLGNRRFAFS